MKKSVTIIGLLLLVGCGPSRNELVNKIAAEYSVLDCDTLRLEYELLDKMIKEERRAQEKTALTNLAVGIVSTLIRGYGGSQAQDKEKQEKLYKDELRLEAIKGLVNKCAAESM